MGMLMPALHLSRRTARSHLLLSMQQLWKAAHATMVLMRHSTSNLARSAGARLDCMQQLVRSTGVLLHLQAEMRAEPVTEKTSAVAWMPAADLSMKRTHSMTRGAMVTANTPSSQVMRDMTLHHLPQGHGHKTATLVMHPEIAAPTRSRTAETSPHSIHSVSSRAMQRSPCLSQWAQHASAATLLRKLTLLPLSVPLKGQGSFPSMRRAVQAAPVRLPQRV